MLQRIKAYILRDVPNKNENSDGAVTIRTCSLIIIAYLFVLTLTLLYTKNISLILFNIIFMALYGYLFWLTYCNRTRDAMLWFNLATVGLVCLDVIYMGWDSGIQHFIFMLILFDLIFSYMSKATQCLIVVVLCCIRLYLYYYCRVHKPIATITGTPDVFIQVLTTIIVFILLYVCGVMLSKDSQNMERKLTKYNEELEQIANTDTLTKLWNRMYLMHYMAEKVDASNGFISIAIGDIDFFKKVNDTYGHECGDEVLRSLARIFVEQMDGHGVVARWGGEEFIFVYEDVNGDEAKIKLAELQMAVKKAVIKYEDIELKVTMTYGLVEYDSALSLDENIKKADDRLYIGKQTGRDKIVY